MPGRRTRIDAGHVIAYQDGGHRYLKDGVVVVEGQEIVHVGAAASYDGPADETSNCDRRSSTLPICSHDRRSVEEKIGTPGAYSKLDVTK